MYVQKLARILKQKYERIFNLIFGQIYCEKYDWIFVRYLRKILINRKKYLKVLIIPPETNSM